jgi:glycopeptide antibiotics resistance protein
VDRHGLYKGGAALYVAVYVLAMVSPRKVPKDQLVANNFLKKLFQDILYISGNLEFIANIFLLIPIFMILVKLVARVPAVYALTICILLSASAEFAQSFIPGRVSTIRDFTLNSIGVISAFILYQLHLNKKSPQKIEV